MPVYVSVCSQSNKAVGELKPPELKSNDEDKRCVHRPMGEQFRPPPQNVVQPRGPHSGTKPPPAKVAKKG